MPRRLAAPRARRLLALTAALLAGAVPVASLAAQAPRAGEAPSARATLHPGDALRIAVWENPALSGEFEVADDGTLRHPVYNRLRVAALPVDSLRGHVVQFLRNFQREPLVNVEPLVRVTVGGEVRTPNVYFVSPSTTVADVIVKAGGIGERGRSDRVQLERDGTRRTIDLTHPDRLRPEVVALRSGDRIVVARRSQIMTEVIGPVSALIGAVAAVILIARTP